MDLRTTLFYAAQGVCLLAVLIGCAKSGSAVKNFFFSVISGIAALFAVNVTGILSGVSLGVNPYTVCVSAAGGVPGVIMLLALKVLCL